MRKFFLLALVISLLGLSVLPTSAQESNVIANGLNNPRGLFYDQNGVLWIAEAGTGGDQVGQGAAGRDLDVERAFGPLVDDQVVLGFQRGDDLGRRRGLDRTPRRGSFHHAGPRRGTQRGSDLDLLACRWP